MNEPLPNPCLSAMLAKVFKRLTLFLILIFPSLCSGQPGDKPLEEIFRKWEDSIPGLMRAQNVPGLSIAVVDAGGIVWARGFGFTDLSESHKVDVNTIFSVQSMSKSFTSLAIVKAAEDGILDLDKPITGYLTDFKVNSRFESDPQEKITIRMMLSHRSGFTHEAPVGNNYYTEGSFDDHISSISETWLRFPVNQRYSYSNLGFDMAGYILQVKAGRRFEDYVKQTILDPLEMKNSSFRQDEIIKVDNRAKGYSSPGIEAPFNFAMIPSGGLYSSVTDLSRFLQMMIGMGEYEGTRIIDTESLESVFEIPGKLPDQISGYGLGISVRNDYGLLLLSHGGAGFGFCSNIVWSPEHKTGVVFLANSSNIQFQNSLPNRILFDLIKAISGTDIIEEFAKTEYNTPYVTIDSLAQKRVSGTYLYNRNGIMILEYEDGRLGIKPQGPQFYPALFTSDNDFNFGEGPYPTFYSVYPGTIERPGYLIRHFDGEYLDFNDSQFDIPGKPESHWKDYTGYYSYSYQGRVSATRIPVTIKNGYLYVFNFKLYEYMPGLFFTSHGEVLDLRDNQVTWRNIRIDKIPQEN